MTYIYTKLDEYDIRKMMQDCNRDNFSLCAIRAYIHFIKSIGDQPQEFDAIAFDCSFIEFDLSNDDERKAFINDYGDLVKDETFSDDDSKVESIMDKLNDETCVISQDYNCFTFDYNF